jgi:hypothetical protein
VCSKSQDQPNGLVIMMYCAYGDESTDDTQSRVYAVAAVFGHQSDWDEIKPLWENRLGGKLFHAVDVEFGQNDFSDLKPGEGRRLYRDVVKIVCASKLIGLGLAINIAEYREVFPGDFDDAPYLWLFGDAVSAMSDLASMAIPPSPVEVVFDRNQNVEYNAALLYDLIRRSKRSEFGKFLGDKVSFATRETFGIQVADLFARESMKRLDGQILPNRKAPRASFSKLSDARRITFRVISGTVDPDPIGSKKECEEKKRNLANSAMREVGSLQKYEEWLKAKRIHDCQSNRIHYIESHAKTLGFEG